MGYRLDFFLALSGFFTLIFGVPGQSTGHFLIGVYHSDKYVYNILKLKLKCNYINSPIHFIPPTSPKFCAYIYLSYGSIFFKLCELYVQNISPV